MNQLGRLLSGPMLLGWLFTECLSAASDLLRIGFISWHRPLCAKSEDPELRARELDIPTVFR